MAVNAGAYLCYCSISSILGTENFNMGDQAERLFPARYSHHAKLRGDTQAEDSGRGRRRSERICRPSQDEAVVHCGCRSMA